MKSQKSIRKKIINTHGTLRYAFLLIYLERKSGSEYQQHCEVYAAASPQRMKGP